MGKPCTECVKNTHWKTNQESYFYQRCLSLLHLPLCIFSVRLVERKKAAVKRCEEQLLKMEVQATDREENKQIALGTSKLNYLDPRISVAWWVNANTQNNIDALVKTLVHTRCLNSCICVPLYMHTSIWGLYNKTRLFSEPANFGLNFGFPWCWFTFNHS